MEADVVVIGCGPGGSSASTFLAQAGFRVLVLEKEQFPRFHIGESLLPYNQEIFREMGVTRALEEANFPRKFGARFHIYDGSKTTRFVFRNGKFTEHTEAIQVERARFDHILMERARASGADVREGWTVHRFEEDEEGVQVEASGPEGKRERIRAKFLIDASGRNNLTGNQAKLREMHEGHRKFAVFGHFKGVKLDEGEGGGDTVIVRMENRWFWLIPVSAEQTSVGLVIDRNDLEREGRDPAAAFWKAVESSAVMRDRLAGVDRGIEVKTIADFSYFNRRLSSGRVLRVGDAAGFMDPIFSAGVYLAMWSGKLAAEAIGKALREGKAKGIGAYHDRVMKAMRLYWRLVENFYTRPFMDLFMNPRPFLDMPSAVVAVLAGKLEVNWRIRWRLEAFYFLVWVQKRWPVVPRVSLQA